MSPSAGSPGSPVAGFTEATAWSALRRAGGRLGVATDGAALMRLGENALFRLRPQPEPLVARVARTMDYWADVEKEVAVAAWLAERGFPAAELSDHAPQPVEAGGHPVTIWRWLEGEPATGRDYRRFGRLLRDLHGLPPPSDFRLPRLDPFGRIEPRIAKAPIADRDQSFLSDLCASLRTEWGTLRFEREFGPIHGDAHAGNVLLGDGRMVLIDFERFAWGPPEWDLVKISIEHLVAGFTTAADYDAFRGGYGADVTAWPGFPTARAIVALGMTTWLGQRVRESEAIAAEFAKRMRTLREGSAETWVPY
ncbi:MAG: phosphotransferase enzyme family protein [Nocardioides sp.]